MSSDDEPLLELEDLALEYSDESALLEFLPDRIKERFDWTPETLRAVDDVSLEIEANDIVVLIGESGSGKTSLGKMAIGAQEPTEGTVRYRGYDIWEAKRRGSIDGMYFEDIRRSLQIVHQGAEAALNPYQKISTILREPLGRWYPELSYADQRERILGLLEQCGLTPPQEYEDRFPHELSGGEQQRVAIIRAMLVEPDLILADEPVSALDPSYRIELLDLMLELQQTFNTTWLLVTHNLETARYITQKSGRGKIAVMHLGNIVEQGPAENILQNPQHPYTKVLKQALLPQHPDQARERLGTDPPLRQLESPDAANAPSGCRFHTRCPKARTVCAQEEPELFENGTGEHLTACYRVEDNHRYWNDEWIDEAGEIMIGDESG